ncbi:hypothetical protein CTAYLR_010447 [Chrysophaeum taylorii]|uniref:Uncharacterized protein n=1 Tax=Chrysophaeum taylorii TaxID=2483200 RepID=A0AAD7U5T5_9STRA|nr:hypothetical protein CTAYLR_010447 [Chrysophaeum taylorii]
MFCFFFLPLGFSLAASLRGIADAPSGTYKGDKTISGVKFKVEMKFSANENAPRTGTLDIEIKNPFDVECKTEPYTLDSDDHIQLDDYDDDDDCVYGGLNAVGAELDYIKYDDDDDKVTIKVKDGPIYLKVDLDHDDDDYQHDIIPGASLDARQA